MPVVKFCLASYKWQSLFAWWPIEGDYHGALINRTGCKKKRGGRGGGGGGGGGGKYLSGPIDTKCRGCCTFPLSGSIQRAGLSGEVEACNTSSQLRACV